MNTETKLPATMEEKINSAINKDVTAGTLISQDGGGVAFSSIEQVMEFAKMMAVSRAAVPKHLRDNPGACLGVCVQALEWRMSPFSVANKSYSVSDRLAYEAQLIQAVINQRAPISGRIKGEYSGEGQNRKLRVWATLKSDDDVVEYTSPAIKDIKVQNSPLWKADPDQQLWYYSTRAMCRRHFPDVILGVYSNDELEGGSMRNVTPKNEPTELEKRLAKASEPVEAEIHTDQHDGDPIKDLKDDDLPARDINDDVEDADLAPEFVASEVFPGDDKFTEGQTAFESGKPESDNPYSENPEYTNWLGGYQQAAAMKEIK